MAGARPGALQGPGTLRWQGQGRGPKGPGRKHVYRYICIFISYITGSLGPGASDNGPRHFPPPSLFRHIFQHLGMPWSLTDFSLPNLIYNWIPRHLWTTNTVPTVITVGTVLLAPRSTTAPQPIQHYPHSQYSPHSIYCGDCIVIIITIITTTAATTTTITAGTTTTTENKYNNNINNENE